LNHQKCNSFQREILLPLGSYYKIKYVYDDIEIVPKAKAPKHIGSIEIDKTSYWGYFDGASQGNPGLCSAGGALVVTEINSCSLKVGLGRGSNNWMNCVLWLPFSG